MPNRLIVDQVCEGSNCQRDRGYCTLREILTHFGHTEIQTPGDNNCHNGGVCGLKETILQTDFTDKTLTQLKCLEFFKYVESRYQSRDIGWNDAFKLWVERGHAIAFTEIYNIDSPKKPRDIYREVMSRNVAA